MEEELVKCRLTNCVQGLEEEEEEEAEAAAWEQFFGSIMSCAAQKTKQKEFREW